MAKSSGSKTARSSGRSPSTGTSTTGTKIRKGSGSLHSKALPDDPIYTRGFAIGGRRTKASFPSTKPTSDSKSEPPS